MNNFLKNSISVAAFAAAAIMIMSCGNNIAPTPTLERWVYVPVSSSNGAAQNQTGLFRISLYTGKRDTLTNVSVERITGVAQNGIVVMEFGDNVQQKLYGKCEDGRLIPVPFPVPADSNWKYEYANPPNMTLNYAGHRLAYQVLYSPKIQNDPSLTHSKLIYFNCDKWEMTIIDLHDFIISQMASQGATNGSIDGEMFFTDQEGSAVFFSVAGYRYLNGNRILVGNQFVEWANDTLRGVGPLSPAPLPLCGFDLITQTALMISGNALSSIALPTGGQTTSSLLSSQLSNRNQFASALSELAAWGTDGIEIRNTISGSLVSKVISFNDLDFKFGQHRHNPNPGLSISPDGQWLAFTLALASDSSSVDLFAVKRDGTWLNRIGEKLKMGTPVVSDDVKN